MLRERGFGLIEVLIAMLLVSLAALMSMTVLKSAGSKQIETNQYMQFILASEGVKDRFNQYLYEPGLTPPVNGLTINSNCSSSDSFIKYLCTAELQLNAAEKITIGLGYKISVAVSKPVNNVCYYNNVINIVDMRSSTQVFTRMFVSACDVKT